MTLEQAAPLGTLGDIILADMAQYIILQFPLQSAMSADVAFLTDETVFRFTLRLDGAPVYASPVTPANGGATRSPFIALAARSGHSAAMPFNQDAAGLLMQCRKNHDRRRMSTPRLSRPAFLFFN